MGLETRCVWNPGPRWLSLHSVCFLWLERCVLTGTCPWRSLLMGHALWFPGGRGRSGERRGRSSEVAVRKIHTISGHFPATSGLSTVLSNAPLSPQQLVKPSSLFCRWAHGGSGSEMTKVTAGQSRQGSKPGLSDSGTYPL